MNVPRAIVEACEVPGHPKWFSIGYGESRVTVHTQQVRALNLAWALKEASRITGPIVVVGGGAAGLSVAAGLAHFGASVTVLERHALPLPLQRNCYKRHLHPHIFDWPDESAAQRTNAGLPLLNWNAGTASTVARSIEASFLQLQELHAGRLQLLTSVNNVQLDVPAPGCISFTRDKSMASLPYDLLVFALGFGVESSFWSGPRGSYWADDSLEQLGVFPPGHYLVSGTGDGGLIDLLRIVLTSFRQEQLARLVEQCADFAERRDEICSIDVRARESSRLARESGDRVLAQRIEGRTLFDIYRAMLPLDGIEEKLRKMLADGVSVVLASRSSSPFSLSARPLHRLLLSYLLFKFGHVVTFRQLDLQPWMLRHVDHRAMLTTGAAEVFDHVVIRHGSASATRQFPQLHADLASRKHVGEPFVTKTHFDKAFGATPAAVAWSADPREEHYLQDCERALVVHSIDATDAPVAKFANIWVELREVMSEPAPTARAQEEDTEEQKAFRESRLELVRLSRERFHFRPGAVAFMPANYEVSGVSALSGAMGTGKSTFLKLALNRALRAYERGTATRFPILLDRDPHLDDMSDDIASAIADIALRSRELGGFSRAAWFIRERMTRSDVVLFVDAFDTWSPTSQAALSDWIAECKFPALLAGRRFGSFVVERLRRIGARFWELEGVPTTELESFARAHECDVSENLRRVLATTREWATNPHLLAQAFRLARANALPNDGAPLSLYRAAVDISLRNASPEVTQFVRSAALKLAKDPPAFNVLRRSLTPELKKRIGEQQILTGGHTLEFSHLSLGEYLAASQLSALSADRSKIRDEFTWTTSLEILPLAHAMSERELTDALAEAEGPDPGHHRLALVLRAVAYGGAAVEDFCRQNGERLVNETARRLSVPSARFGDAERGLMRSFERAGAWLPRVSVRGRLPEFGEPGAEAWHLKMTLDQTTTERPPQSLWWATIFHQAGALASKAPKEVIPRTRGGEVFDHELAISALGDHAERADLLAHPWSRLREDELARCHDAPSARQLGLIGDDDRRVRSRAIHAHEHLWSSDVGQEILASLWDGETDPSTLVAILAHLKASPLDATSRLRKLLVPRTRVSGGEIALCSALLQRCGSDARIAAEVNAFLRAGAAWFVPSRTLAALFAGDDDRRRILLDRLAADPTDEEIRAAGTLGNVCVDALRQFVHRHSRDRSHAYRVAAAIGSLPLADEQSRAERLHALEASHIVGIDGDARRRKSAIQCAAIKSFNGDPNALALLSPFFSSADESVVYVAVETLGTDVPRDVLLGFVRDGPHNAAIAAVKLLALDERNAIELENECRTRRATTNFRLHGEYVRAAIVDAIGPTHTDAWLLDLVDDPDDAVRAAAAGQLVQRGVEHNRIRRRALIDQTHAVRNKLWPTLAHDAEGREFLEIQARADQPDLRRAYFSLLSRDAAGRTSLLEYFRERRAAGASANELHDMIWPLARDPNARNDLVSLAAETRSLDVVVSLMAALPADAELRAAAHRILEDSAKLHAGFMFSSVSDAFEKYFRHDHAAQAIALARLRRRELATCNIDIPLVANFEPARALLHELIDDSDLNASRHARAALAREPEVCARLVKDLASSDQHVRRDAAESLRELHEAQRTLSSLVGDEDKSIREIAYRALAQLDELAPRLDELMEREETSALRVEMLEFLPDAHQSSGALVRYAVSDASAEVRAAAAGRLPQDVEPVYVALRDAAHVRALFSAQGAAVARFFGDQRDLRQRDEPELFAIMATWLSVKLVSSLPSAAVNISDAVRHVDAGCFGECVRSGADAQHVQIRLAMDAQQLPRDRGIWPAANVALGWHIARHLIASAPASIVVACTDVACTRLTFPALRAGAIAFGPTYFGFGLREG